MSSCLVIALSIAVGWVGWSGNLSLFPIATLFPMIWGQTKNRPIAAACALFYHLAGSRGLPLGTSTFMGTDMVTGLLIWLLAACVQAAVFYFAWHPKKTMRIVFIPFILTAISLPPLGIVSWGNPITSAGVFFPGWGWCGILLILVLVMLIARYPILAMVPVGYSLLLLTGVIHLHPPVPPSGWVGINAPKKPPTLHRAEITQHYKMLDQLNTTTANMLIFPESAGGTWSAIVYDIWADNPVANKAIIFGATLIRADRQKDNVLILVQNGVPRICYQQRMPVPLSMWAPWQQHSYRAHWFENSVIQVGNARVCPLICYEQFLIWPVLHSMLQNPDIIVAVSNAWWAEKTSIPAIQKMVVMSWGMLFGTGVVVAGI